ncbi:MAG: hypothetical protein HZA50_11010 [Planctomycetes bacterium]|nr:hypothetical protein [Planctomycetota bacterium]
MEQQTKVYWIAVKPGGTRPPVVHGPFTHQEAPAKLQEIKKNAASLDRVSNYYFAENHDAAVERANFYL